MASEENNTLHEDIRFKMLSVLHDNPEISQRELAKAVGISVGRTHYVLKALVEMGLVKLERFSASPDKRRYTYLLTREGISRKTSTAKHFLARKIAEYEALREEIDSLKQSMRRDLEQEAAEQQDE
jgi:EPS-associated MarR family transcriptional regulator